MVFDLVCWPRWGGMFIRGKESVFLKGRVRLCNFFYGNSGVDLVDDSAPALREEELIS